MKKLLNQIRLRLALFGCALRLRFTPHSALRTPQFFNIGDGTREHGVKPFIPDAATTLTGRYLLWKIGATDGDHIAVCTAGDTPLGSSDDAADTANLDVPIGIKLFGAVHGTVRVISDGTLTNGGHVKCGANGQATLASSTNRSFGIAIIGTDQTSAAGDVVEIIPCVPHLYVF